MKLVELGEGAGHLKAGFQGFQKSGKTFTAVLLAIATRQKFGLKGPIGFLDSENATEYVAPLVKQLTGLKLIGLRTRKFSDLLEAPDEMIKAGVSVMVADSMTHYWRYLCDSQLAGINETRRRYNKPPRSKLEFQDWASVKTEWSRWTERYLNSPLHIIICGRAGYEYDMEKNEETGRNELVKTGVKMKTEAEFGFEPSLLVEMEAERMFDDDGNLKLLRKATVIGDRFGVIDGKVFPFSGIDNDRTKELAAVAKAFDPHLNMLIPGSHSTVDASVTPATVDESGDAQWRQDAKERAIIIEEIQGEITSRFPGQSTEDKKSKADIMQSIFGTRSWTAIQEKVAIDDLRKGLATLRLGGDAPTPARAPRPAPAATPAEPAAESIRVLPPASSPDPKPETKIPLPDGEDAELISAIGADNLGRAMAWLVKNRWLTAEQAQDGFKSLPADKRQSILVNPARFIRAINLQK